MEVRIRSYELSVGSKMGGESPVTSLSMIAADADMWYGLPPFLARTIRLGWKNWSGLGARVRFVCFTEPRLDRAVFGAISVRSIWHFLILTGKRLVLLDRQGIAVRTVGTLSTVCV